MCRPVRLQCLDFKFSKDAAASLVTGWTVHSVAELRRAPELVAMAAWLRSGKEDFFACPDVVAAAIQTEATLKHDGAN
jgi:hypothetical protein